MMTRLLVFLISSFFFCSQIFAVTLKLKNGTAVSGNQVELGSSYIVIDFYGVDVRYDFDRLYSIDDVVPEKFIDHHEAELKEDADMLEKEGIGYALNGDFLTANELFNKSILLGGDEASLKRSLQTIRDYKNGILHLDAAKAIFLAKHYISTGQYRQSISQYQKAIDISPLYPNSYQEIARIYLYLKDFETALRYFEMAVTKDRNRPEIHASLGMLYFYFARTVEARRSFKSAESLFNEKGAFSDAEAVANILSDLP